MEDSYSITAHHWIKKFKPNKQVLSIRVYRFAKRFSDLLIIVLAMPFWLPIIGVIALLIRITSSGASPIFSQARTGQGGCRFQMFKFRTMVPNADALKEKYIHLNDNNFYKILQHLHNNKGYLLIHNHYHYT